MKHQQHCPAVDLQPLDFQKEKDDGHEAVFRALIAPATGTV